MLWCIKTGVFPELELVEKQFLRPVYVIFFLFFFFFVWLDSMKFVFSLCDTSWNYIQNFSTGFLSYWTWIDLTYILILVGITKSSTELEGQAH